MIPATIAFVSGVLLLQFQPSLPAPLFMLLLPVLVLFAWRYRFRWVIQLPVLLLCGFFWAALMAHWAMQSDLPKALEGADLQVIGVIESLPDVTVERTRFQFRVESLLDNAHCYSSPGRVQLSWYRNAPALSAGERWQLSVRIKRPHGMSNPGAPDYESRLFQKGIRASGYVRADRDNRRLGVETSGYLFERMRQAIADRIDALAQPHRSLGLMRALAIGDRSRISTAEWAVFRDTGTNHLVAISGLHIGIVSGLAWVLCGWLWRRSAVLCNWVPAPQAGAVAALASGCFYAGLAGFAIPCVRALVMLVVLLGGVLCRRTVQPARGLCIALITIVLLDPASVVAPGFWLSFGAVAVIFLGIAGRLRIRSAVPLGLFRIQWVVALGLAPMLLLLGFEWPLISPLVNVIVVPLFSLLLVPATLMAVLILMLWPSLGVLLVSAIAGLLGWTQSLLALAAEYGSSITLTGAPPLWMLLAVLLSILLWLLPAGIPGRRRGVLLIMPLLLHRPAPVPSGDLWITLLDVGQGLAIVLETANHVLLYDTGPMFPSGFNTGDAVVLPFLKSRAVEKIDRIVLSNGDMDHRGGLAAVLQRYPSAELVSGEPGRISLGHPRRCTAGASWAWDGIRFEMLHPDDSPRWRGNNASCVLSVSTAAGQLLLTGDIEAEAEAVLVEKYGERLRSVVVTVPHHGSASSSGNRFIGATGPRYGLISAGYLNRYGFPRTPVLTRWQEAKTLLLSTADSGAISLRFKADGQIEGPFSHRQVHRRYWMTPAH